MRRDECRARVTFIGVRGLYGRAKALRYPPGDYRLRTVDCRLLLLPPYHSPWLCIRVAAFGENDFPIHDNPAYAGRKLMRCVEGCAIGNGGRIEHDNVRLHPRSQPSSVA